MQFYLISFESTHKAIKTERLFKGEFSIEMIPTPREITASCGLSIKVNDVDLRTIVSKLLSLGDESSDIKIFRVNQIGDKKMVENLEWR